MFEALVQRLFNKILAQFIENFSAQNLSIGIWSGQIILKNIRFKKDIINKLNLPFKIKYSRVGCLKMNIPWKNLTSSKIQVLLETFELLIQQIPEAQWQCKDTNIIQKRKKQIQNYCESVLSNFSSNIQQNQQNQEGYLSKLTSKIIDNLQVKIRDIHIRYENQFTKAFSFGITLEQFKLYTVNLKGEPEYIDRTKPQYINQPLRKRMQLNNIGIYWNQKSQVYNQSNYQHKMSSSIATKNQTKFQQHYIILMSSQAKMLQRQPGTQFVYPQIDLSIDLQTLKIEISNNQLQQIIILAERLQKFTKQIKYLNRAKLDQDTIDKYIKDFQNLFPEYYKQWGKGMSESNLKKIDTILQKIQVDKLQPVIKKYLQAKQKQRMINQKKQKNRGWFGRPKQLTPQQIQDIEKYMNDNFSQQVTIVKRPQNYNRFSSSFTIKKFQVGIVNKMSIIQEGIRVVFDQLEIQTALRQKGFQLILGLQDIRIDIFKKSGIQSQIIKKILYKIIPQDNVSFDKYLKLIIKHKPLEKKHLDTDIILQTSELFIIFDPHIIQIATQFADLKFNKQNTQAVYQKYEEYKEITSAAIAQSTQKQTKTQIGLDILINMITVAIPFSSKQPSSDCWGINFGRIRMQSNQQIILKTEIIQNEPLEAYNIKLTNFSFRHYVSINELQFQQKNLVLYKNLTNSIIDNLDFQVKMQIYRKSTQNVPKFKVKLTLPELLINISKFTYLNLLKINRCFQLSENIQDYKKNYIKNQKTQIMNKSCKIGFVHIKDSTKTWKKYVAIMSQNFIYIYRDKKDENYAAFYFIKGANLQKHRDALDKQKPFHFKIKNKFNEVVFGFDKEDLIQDWIKKIKKMQQSQFQQELISAIFDLSTSAFLAPVSVPKPIDHNKLNAVVEIIVKSTNINVHLTDSIDPSILTLNIKAIAGQLYLHQSKRLVNLSLYSIQLMDNINKYKMEQLKYFVISRHERQETHLISIQIQQIDKKHPKYDRNDSTIKVNFGTLKCNYKCETVKHLISFFVANTKRQQQQYQKQIELVQQKNESIYLQNEEHFTLKLNLNISQITINLINQKTKTIMGQLSISNFNLYNSLSQKRIFLKGDLGQFYYKDYTNYPKTIFLQQQTYGQGRYIIVGEAYPNMKMLDFQIQLLKKINQNSKSLLININMNNLKKYYTQQPVLRIIALINNQILPSIQTQQQKSKQNDVKPDPSSMNLSVKIRNVNVFVEPNRQNPEPQGEFIKLNINEITVKNQCIYRKYVKSGKSDVLVQNYTVQLNQMSIYTQYVDFKNKKHSYKLTNNIDLTCSNDLIANPKYYQKIYGSEFQNGLRTQCTMTPFFMRINNDDYSFIMKCLNCSITHDDGAEQVLFGKSQIETPIKDKPIQNNQKIYLAVQMDHISIFLTQYDIPIAFLVLNSINYNQAIGADTQIGLTIQYLYGTVIQNLPQKHLLIQKGLFNALGYTDKHEIQDLNNISLLIKQFDKSHRLSCYTNKIPFLSFKMQINPTKKLMVINIDELTIDLDLKILYVLASLVNLDPDYIKSPKPVIQADKENQLSQKQIQSIKQEMWKSQIPTQLLFKFQISKFTCSISDRIKQDFIIFEGDFHLTRVGQGDRNIKYLKSHFIKQKSIEKINHSFVSAELNHFSIYFCTFKNGLIRNKRQILKPINLSCIVTNFYMYQYSVIVLSANVVMNIQQLLLNVCLKDVQKIKNILKDSTQTWNEQQPKSKEQLQRQNRISVRKAQNKAIEKIQISTKLKAIMPIIQIDIINDSNNSFMPVLRFIIHETEPFMHLYLIKTHLILVPIISLLYFNPRSSSWQPIIETFKPYIDYLLLIRNDGPHMTLLVQTDKQITASLKVNISTQMISTLLSAKQITSNQKGRTVSNLQAQEVQISSFIFHNITNSRIFLSRGQKQFQIQPLFKGPIRLQMDKQIQIRMANHRYNLKLDHYGILKIPQSKYLIQYDFQKLNRIIKFVPTLMIKNCTQNTIYIKLETDNQQSIKTINIAQIIPLDHINKFSLSLRGTSYTEKVSVQNISIKHHLYSEHRKFLVLLNHKQVINKYTTLQVIAPLVIHNYLPKMIQLQFIYQLKTIITKQIQAQKTHEVCASQDIKKLEFRTLVKGYTWTKKFGFTEETSEDQLQLQLEDQDCAKTIINYKFSRSKNLQYTLTIYCKRIIINQLKDKLIVHGDHAINQKDKSLDLYSLLGGQIKSDPTYDDKLVMVGEEVGNNIRVCGVNSLIDFATPICIGGLGSSQSRIVVDRIYKQKMDSLFTVVNVQISLMKISQSSDLFCKTIFLRNKSIIINNTKNKISIMEAVSDYYKFEIKAGAKQSFIFAMPHIKQRGKYGGVIIQNAKYRSKVVDFSEKSTVFFKMYKINQKNQKQQQNYVYHKICVKQHESYLFHQIFQVFEQQLPYQIIIKSPNIKALLVSRNKTVWHSQIYRFIKETYQDEQHQICIWLSHRDNAEYAQIKIYPDDLNYRTKQSLTKARKQKTLQLMPVEIYVTFTDTKKIINIDEVYQYTLVREIDVQCILLNLSQIVISINQNLQQHQQPYESLVITLQRTYFIRKQTDKKTQYQFKLGFIQIDQAFPHTLSNPVIITPNKFQQFTRTQKPLYIFNSTLVINNELKQYTFINKIEIDINDLVVQGTVDFINLIIIVAKQYAQVINFKQQNYTVSTKLKTQKWKDIIIPKEDKKVFIKSIQISPFCIDLSAQLKINKIKIKNNEFVSTILSAIGVVVSNIEAATISLNGIQITNCIDTADIITAELIKRYKHQITAQLFKIVGSLNIIGNPMGLLKNISTGFKDLKQKPAQGFVNGPAQFGLGIAEGARSLVAHTVGGAFKSLSGITGTLSTGLATLAFDKEFEEHRQKQKMKKPQNIIQGFQKGGKAIFYGFKEGITGVFLQPYQNARQEGAVGFFKGTAKGLAGLVVKPVTGIIDFASKATEGIKNQALIFEDKPNDQRMRYPRVFYSFNFIMKEYCLVDSNLQSIMKKVQYQDKFAESVYFQAFFTANQHQYLVIQLSHFALLNIKKRKIKWIMQIDYTQIQHQNNIIQFRNKKTSKINTDNHYVQFNSQSTANKTRAFIQKHQKERAESL